MWLRFLRWSLDDDVSNRAFRTMLSVSLLIEFSANRLFVCIFNRAKRGDGIGGGGNGIVGGLLRLTDDDIDALELPYRFATELLAILTHDTPGKSMREKYDFPLTKHSIRCRTYHSDCVAFAVSLLDRHSCEPTAIDTVWPQSRLHFPAFDTQTHDIPTVLFGDLVALIALQL